MHTVSPPAEHTQHSQIDEPTWLTARRFRLIAADGQSRVFAVDSASADADTGQAAADGQYGQWVRALARVALANLEETLDHLALKAGLSSGEWRSGTSFSVFAGQVFHEERRR